MTDVLNQSEKFVVVAEQVRIVEGRIVVGRACDRQLDGLVRNLLHRSTIAEHNTVDRGHVIRSDTLSSVSLRFHAVTCDRHPTSSILRGCAGLGYKTPLRNMEQEPAFRRYFPSSRRT